MSSIVGVTFSNVKAAQSRHPCNKYTCAQDGNREHAPAYFAIDRSTNAFSTKMINTVVSTKNMDRNVNFFSCTLIPLKLFKIHLNLVVTHTHTFEFALLFGFHIDRSFLSGIFIISKRNQKKNKTHKLFFWQLHLRNWNISNSSNPVAKIPFETLIARI